MAGSYQPSPRRIAVGSTATALVSLLQGDAVVRIEGDVDLANGRQLYDALVGIVADHRPKRVTVDLSGLAFVDGSGRAALRRFIDRAGLAGVHISGTAPRAVAVRLSLEVGGLRFNNSAESGSDGGS